MTSISVAPAPLSEHVRAIFGPYLGPDDAVRLNLGCAKNPLSGFLNLDLDHRATADVYHDLEDTPLPFPAETFDCVLGSHVFEHVRNFVPLVADLYRILKPGGYLISVTPHCGSDDAWDSPHHVRAFSENTWHYLCADLYDRDTIPHAGFGAYQGGDYRPWQVVEVALVPHADFAGEDPKNLRVLQRRCRNVISEVHAVLRKPL